MGCIRVTVESLGGIAAAAVPAGGIAASAIPLTGITAAAGRLTGIAASVEHRDGISVSTSLLCAVGASRYLRVVPQEAQWIDVDTSVTYAVTANVDWNID